MSRSRYRFTVAEIPGLPPELVEALMTEDPPSGLCRGGRVVADRDEAIALLSDPAVGDWVGQRGLDRATRVGGSEAARKLVADRLNAVAANWSEMELVIARATRDVVDHLEGGQRVDLVAVAVEPVIERLGELAIGATAAEFAPGSLLDAGHELVVSLLDARPVNRGVRRLLARVAATPQWAGSGPEGRAAVRTLLAGVVEAPRAALGGLLRLLLTTMAPELVLDDGWVRDALRVVSPVRATVVVDAGDAADPVACSYRIDQPRSSRVPGSTCSGREIRVVATRHVWPRPPCLSGRADCHAPV